MAMVQFSSHNVKRDGKRFIPKILVDPVFKRNGVIYGKNGELYWSVIDPERHPLFVWPKTSGDLLLPYSNTIEPMGTVVFTNGPMMERFTKQQIKRNLRASAGIGAVLGGLLTGLFLGSKYGATLGPKGVLAGAFLGALLGAFGGYILGGFLMTNDWAPYGPVKGNQHGVADPGKNRNGELYRFGRNGNAFKNYKVEGGQGFGDFHEMIGGLIPILLGYNPMKTVPGPNYNSQFALLAQRQGITAWGIIPLMPTSTERTPGLGAQELKGIDLSRPGKGPLKGVIIAAGSQLRHTNDLGTILMKVGTKDAVAMDGSDSVMMGAGTQHFLNKPPTAKQRIQRYGFYCK